MTAVPGWIAVDWGTSSCRAALVDQTGETIDAVSGGPGILGVADRGFAAALQAMIGPWRQRHPDTPVVLSGMIGSRQGWHEVPYVACPAGLADVAKGLAPVAADGFGEVIIVPGLAIRTPGRAPDVMRGEETQIFGCLAAARATEGLFVLPGTHSKWVTVRAGRIVSFQTFMTGEIYAALKAHTILGRLMTPVPDHVPPAARAFEAGVSAGSAEGGPGALLHRVFATRTHGLFAEFGGHELADYLSGLLIGAELTEAASGARITAIGGADLTSRYARAAQMLGLAFDTAPTDCAARGAAAILTAGVGSARP